MSKITRKDLEEKFGKPCIEIIPDAALPNPNDPGTMPEETADQIANCIENATEQVRRYTPNVPQSEVRRRTGITIRNQPFILDAIEYAQEFPNTVPPQLNILDWLSDLARYNIFILLFRLAEILTGALRWAFRIFAVAAFNKFGMYYRYVRTASTNGDREAQVIFERLQPYFERLPNFERAEHLTQDQNADLELDLDIVRDLLKSNNSRIKSLIKKEKSIKRELNKDLEQQDELLDEK